jgi:hypothetical protein
MARKKARTSNSIPDIDCVHASFIATPCSI